MPDPTSETNNPGSAGGDSAPGAGAKRESAFHASGRRRRITIIIALAVVVAAAVFGGRWIAYNRTHARTDDAQVESTIYAVSSRVSGHALRVLVSTNQRVGAGQLLAEIDPRDYRVAVAQAEAALAAAQSAAAAAAGTVQLTEQTGSAGISQAAAQVAAAEAGEVASARQSQSAASQVEAARADEGVAAAAIDAAARGVTAAQAALTSARAKADEARKDAERMDSLLAGGAVSEQQRDAAAAAAISAQAGVDAAQAQVESAQAVLRQARERERQAQIAVKQAIENAAAAGAHVSQAKSAVRQAQAGLRAAETTPVQTQVRRSEAGGASSRVAQAKAQVEQARLNLSYTRIVAPAAGVIAQKNVHRGQFVTPGQPLIALVGAGTAHITANFKETQMTHIRVGQRATFTVDAYPGVTFTGHVESISPGTGAVFSLLPPENATGNFTKVVQRVPVRIAIDHRRGQPVLRDGMSVVVSIETK